MTDKRMKIITINVPKIFLKAFKQIEEHYSSRSEAIRVAIREFLIKEIKLNGLLTGEDHEDFIRVVKETPTENLFKLKHQKKPIGNGYYLEELEEKDSPRDSYPDIPDYKYFNEEI